jgi:aarF domain-containing kinase
MAFEEGFKATEVEKMDEAGISRRDVAHLISSVFASQVFSLEDGFVHCDPHPANVLVRKGSKGKPELVLVDHGLYRPLDRDFQVNYAALWKALLLADLNGIRESCSSLGIEKAYTLFAAMLTARPFDEIMERSKRGGSVSLNNVQPSDRADQAMIRGYAQKYLHEIFGLLARLPRQMLLLLKMNDCLRHIDYKLGSPTNTLAVTGRYAAKAVFEEKNRLCKSAIDRLRNSWEHWSVMWRIHLHDFVVWLIDQQERWHGLFLI